jgi:hypothetical protein
MATLDFSSLTGVFKEAYGSKIADNIPDSSIVTRLTEFQKGEKMLGNLYHVPVKVQANVGATYNSDGSAFTILSALPMLTKDAQIRGSEILIPGPVSYATITRSAGKNSFGRAMDLMIDDLRKSMRKRVELGLLWGGATLSSAIPSGAGLGNTTAGGGTATSATVETIIIDLAHWAPGIWAGLTGAQVNFYTVTTGALVSSAADAIFTVTSVTMSTRAVAFTGTSTGCTALHTASSAAMAVLFRGAIGVEMTGLYKIINNTGTLFNVDGATYEQWQGNTYSAASAQLTFEKLQDAVAALNGRGLEEDVTVLVAPTTYAKLNSELAGARVLDSSYDKSKGKNGVEAIEFFGSNGKIQVVSHPYMKESFAMILPMDHVYRIGSTEPTFQPVPGAENVFHQNSTAGVEIRVYTDQAVFVDAPSYCCLITGITN